MVAVGHEWLLGACMVAGGHAWLPGGHAWLLGGMCGCLGGMYGCWGCAWLPRACVVARGMHSCGERACVGLDEIQSMSGRYASYWNAFLFGYFNNVYSCGVQAGSTFVSLPDKYMFTIVFSVAKYIKFKIL